MHRSASSDSEASTASQSSLASDASFYDALDDVADLAAVRGVDPPADPPVDPLGLGLHTLAPVLSSREPETAPPEAPRAPPLLRDGVEPGVAISARGWQPSGPAVPQAASRAGPPVAQTGTRSATAPPRPFGASAPVSRPPGPPTSGPGSPILGLSMGESLLAQATDSASGFEAAASAEAGAAQEGAANDGSRGAPSPPPDPQARRSASSRPAARLSAARRRPACLQWSNFTRQGGRPAPGAALVAATARALAGSSVAEDDPSDSSDDDDDQDDAAAAPVPPEDPATDGYPPGRAAGMLPAGGVATATADRAPAAAAAANQHSRAPGDVADATPGKTAAATPTKDPANAVRSPGRAGGMLADGDASVLAVTAQVSAAAVTAAAHRVAVVAAAQAPPSGRAAVEHHARAEPYQDHDFLARARAELQDSDATSRSRRFTADGDEAKTEDSDAVAAQLKAAQAAPGPRTQHHVPNIGSLDPVLAVYAHNASAFSCALCAHTARDLAALTKHRHSAHRRIRFVDHFHSGCTCGIGFRSRAAATRHAQACAHSTHTAVTVARDPTSSVLHVDSEEEDLAPSGPLLAAASAAVAAASSDTTAADTATLQSVVPTATPGLQYDPHALEPLSPPPEHRVAGKRRRLNPPIDPQLDLDELMQEAEEELLQDIEMEVHAPPTPVSTATTTATSKTTRWGPHPKAVAAAAIAQLVTGEAAAAPAPSRRDRRPVQQHQAPTRSRWGPRHRAVGAAAIASLATGLPTKAALVSRPDKPDEGRRRLQTRWGPKVCIPRAARRPASRWGPPRAAGAFGQLPASASGATGQLPEPMEAHIDRKANAHADRLANKALDQRRTSSECGPHDQTPTACYQPTTARTPTPSAETPAPVYTAGDSSGDDGDEVQRRQEVEVEAEIAARDGGETFPTLPIGPGSAPARQPRLRLRQLSDDEHDAASAALQTFAEAMASKIVDADSWASGEGYIGAIPDGIREVLRPYSSTLPVNSAPRPHQHHNRPPRVTRTQREHRLDEALDDLSTVQRTAPTDQRAVRKARRRVGRVRTSMATQELRQAFAKDEAKCVERLLKSVLVETAGEEHPETCPIGRDELHRHFTGTSTAPAPFHYDATEGQEFRAAMDSFLPATAETDAFEDELTVDDVEDQLSSSAKDSSPGHDGISYAIYRRFAAQLVPLLHAAFQFCWLHRRVPALWKVGIVRLIHKKGDPMQPANWRPICLQPTIYKLYSGLLARRLSRWLERNGRLPMAQKGFRAFNGCHEHNFTATSLLDQTRRMHRKLYQVWYDLRNAFGSLPQQLMWRVLRHLGVENSFIARCQDIYDGSAFVVGNAADGPTDPVRQEVGVYQGCPLSPLLFISALVPLVRRLEQLDGVGVPLAEGVRPCTTAYADDLKVFSDSAAGIRKCHGVVARFLAWTGLRANPAKCASLAVTTNARGNPVRDDTMQLQLHGDAIATLSLQESYRYLGVGDGFDHVRHRLQLEPKIQQIKREAVALMQSGLAAWQVVKALKTYVYPKVEYALRHLRPLQSQLQGFDRTVVRGLRHLMHLPQSATTEFFYTPTSGGGLGLQSLVEMHQALQVAHAWQMLHSKDPAVVAVAKTQVCQVARKRFRLQEEHWRGRDDELVRLFLNSELAASPHAEKLRRNGDIGSMWTDVQRTLCLHHLSLTVQDDRDGQDELALRVPHHTKWLDHKTVLRHVKLHMKIRHQTRWKGLVDQGKTVRVHGGLGAKFVTTGAGLSDAEHRFGIMARLNQVDTNAVLKRKRLRSSKTCRDPTCSSAETLAHTLNHCASNMDAIRQRHDDALEQIGSKIRGALERAKSTTELRLNQTVPEYTGAALRPDIVLRNVAAKKMVIADLAVTFEDHAAGARHSSLQLSHDYKTLKYQPIVAELRVQGWQVQTAAIVYGSLGSVQPSNFKTYTEKLKLHKREARQLDLQLSSHCIRASHRIWGWHCRRHREGQRSGNASRAPRGSGGTPRRASQARARR
ncbi:Retrovirus-related Pol polyprotein from type-2 retrotransposable element R2DM [Phytophthora citrophthora]|uniref:Retrovirus-related Pol polyprotein from type-2 retrotransposable element R2DM n=1 Tax=Phytophthora citrophthora TaxID=4793 RepID=A0AAD9GBS7_9STRA|nr:Retrovirus-related Pol polyprotein from type-2 retrotransposable element R2DM [Phytophthora citrophthora]